jgi:hypothetical protein
LRKACKPGIPGCVLYRKVRFISELELEIAQRSAAKLADSGDGAKGPSSATPSARKPRTASGKTKARAKG